MQQRPIFAIRNRNGGFLVIGFDDATHLPDSYALDEDVGTLYHVDTIQGLVSPHFQFDVLHPDLPAAFSVFIHRG